MRLFDFSKILPSLKRGKLVAYDAVFVFFLFGFIGMSLVNFNLHWAAFSLAAIIIGSFLIFQEKVFREVIGIIFISLAVFSGYAWIHQANYRAVFLVGEKIKAIGTIKDFIHNSPSYILVKVRTDRGDFNILTDGGDFHIGDRVRIEGVVYRTRSAGAYLNKQKITLVEHSKNKTGLLVETVRDWLFENIGRSLPASEAALANGLLLGDTSGFSKEFKDDLRKTGTSHIVALSGWNVMILMTVSISILGMFLKRRSALFFSIILILILWLLAGYSASLLRSVIMGSVFILAAFFGKKYSLRNALAFSAFTMSLFDPGVSGDLGFQLSFAAILGLATFSGGISKAVDKISVGKIINKMGFSETVSAQLAVTPVILWNGITVAPIGLIANLAIISLIPITYLFVFLTSLVGDKLGIVSWLVSFVANILLNYEIKTIAYFADIL